MSRGTPVRLTTEKIDAMKPGEILWDSLITGFHVRAGRRNKSFLFYYRSPDGGGERRPKIGNYGSLTLDAARTVVQEWAKEYARTRCLKPEEAPALLKTLEQWERSNLTRKKSMARLIRLCLFNAIRVEQAAFQQIVLLTGQLVEKPLLLRSSSLPTPRRVECLTIQRNSPRRSSLPRRRS